MTWFVCVAAMALGLAEQTAEDRVRTARARVAREEYDAAYDLLQKALVTDARSVEGLDILGFVSSQLARREFDRLFKLAPDGARVHQLLGQSFRSQEKLAEAAAEYELALRANPTLVEALIELADIRREESNCDDAAMLYERARRVKNSYEAAYGLGVCLAAQDEHARAVGELREAVKHDPKSASAHFALGSSLLRLGDAAAAIIALERAVVLEPRMRQGHYLLGRAYGAVGQRERSRQAFAQADALAQSERSGDQKALQRKNPR